MLRFILWKVLCFWFVFRIYGPDLTPEKFQYYAKALGQLYCGESPECVSRFVRQAAAYEIMAKDGYKSFANHTNFLKESFVKIIKNKIWSEKDEEWIEPPEQIEGNITSLMAGLIHEVQAKYEAPLKKNYKEEVKQKLKTIAFDYRKMHDFCTVDFGLKPSVVMQQINEIAEMTKMPKNLQKLLEKAVKVRTATSKTAESIPIAVDGVVHFILIAALRKANNSFDVGMAVFSVDYKIASKDFQRGNKETLEEFIRFSNGTRDAKGVLTFEGGEDMAAYFYGKAVEIFMHKCPSLLAGFKEIQKDIKKLD